MCVLLFRVIEDFVQEKSSGFEVGLIAFLCGFEYIICVLCLWN